MGNHNRGSQVRLSGGEVQRDNHPKLPYEAAFTLAHSARLNLLNSRTGSCSDAEWEELINLGIRERKSRRGASWSLVEQEPSARDLYDDLWQEVHIHLLRAKNRTLPKLRAYFDRAFLNEFLKYIESPKRRHGITEVPRDGPRIHTHLASDLEPINANQADSDQLETLHQRPALDEKEENELSMLVALDSWQELRDIRQEAVKSWTRRNADWRDHWLPFLYYRASRVETLADAAKVVSIGEETALDFEARAMATLLSLDPAVSPSGGLNPGIQLPQFPSVLQHLLATVGQADSFPFKEWVGLRCDPVGDRIDNPTDALQTILRRRHLQAIVSRFEKRIAVPVRIRRQQEAYR